MEYTFEEYLIRVGIRSHEFTYDNDDITDNIEYFRDCYKSNLSEYNSLIFLYDFIQLSKERNDKIDIIIKK